MVLGLMPDLFPKFVMEQFGELQWNKLQESEEFHNAGETTMFQSAGSILGVEDSELGRAFAKYFLSSEDLQHCLNQALKSCGYSLLDAVTRFNDLTQLLAYRDGLVQSAPDAWVQNVHPQCFELHYEIAGAAYPPGWVEGLVEQLAPAFSMGPQAVSASWIKGRGDGSSDHEIFMVSSASLCNASFSGPDASRLERLSKCTHGLSANDFSHMFSFHLVLNAECRIVQAGDALQRLYPGLMAVGQVAALAKDHFKICSSAGPAGWEFESLLRHQGHISVTLMGMQGLQLKGRFVRSQMSAVAPEGSASAARCSEGRQQADDCAVFLGSPWVSSLSELQSCGLTLSDFHPGDVSSDWLLQSERMQAEMAIMQDTNAQLEAEVQEMGAELVRLREVHAVDPEVLSEGEEEVDEFSQPSPNYPQLDVDVPADRAVKLMDRFLRGETVSLMAVEEARNALLMGQGDLRQPVHFEAKNLSAFTGGDAEVNQSLMDMLVPRRHGVYVTDRELTTLDEGSDDESRSAATVAREARSNVLTADNSGFVFGFTAKGMVPYSRRNSACSNNPSAMGRDNSLLALVNRTSASTYLDNYIPTSSLPASLHASNGVDGGAGGVGISYIPFSQDGRQPPPPPLVLPEGGRAGGLPQLTIESWARSNYVSGEVHSAIMSPTDTLLGDAKQKRTRFIKKVSLTLRSLFSSKIPADDEISEPLSGSSARNTASKDSETAGHSSRYANIPGPRSCQEEGGPNMVFGRCGRRMSTPLFVTSHYESGPGSSSGGPTSGVGSSLGSRLTDAPRQRPAWHMGQMGTRGDRIPVDSTNSTTDGLQPPLVFSAPRLPLTLATPGPVKMRGYEREVRPSHHSFSQKPQASNDSERGNGGEAVHKTLGMDLREAFPATSKAESPFRTVAGSAALALPKLCESPSEELSLVLSHVDEWQFDVFALERASNGRPLSLLAFFLMKRLSLPAVFGIDEHKLASFLISVENNYQPNPYHNRTHAADVLRNIHVIATRSGILALMLPQPADSSPSKTGGGGEEATSPTKPGSRPPSSYQVLPLFSRLSLGCEVKSSTPVVCETPLHHTSPSNALTLLTVYFAAIIHDYEHRGVNNAFLIQNEDPLALLYNDLSPMENHHAAAGFMLLKQGNLNFMEKMPHKLRAHLRAQVIDMILATDMKQHFSTISTFSSRFACLTVSPTAWPTHPFAAVSSFGTSAPHHLAQKVGGAALTTSAAHYSRMHRPPKPWCTSLDGSVASGANTPKSLVRHIISAEAGSPASVSSSAPSMRNSPSDYKYPDPYIQAAAVQPAPGPGGDFGVLSKIGGFPRSAFSAAGNAPESGRQVVVGHRRKLQSASSGSISLPRHDGPQDSPLRPNVGFVCKAPAGGSSSSDQHDGRHSDSPFRALGRWSTQSAQPESSAPALASSLFGGSSQLPIPLEQSSMDKKDRLRAPSRRGISVPPRLTITSSTTGAALTDMAQSPGSMGDRTTRSQHGGPLGALDEEARTLMWKMALKCADLGHLAGPRPVHHKWVTLLEEEMFRQGDRERSAGISISALMDRRKMGITKSQPGFFNVVALPLIGGFVSVFPGASPLLAAVKDNHASWIEPEPVRPDSTA